MLTRHSRGDTVRIFLDIVAAGAGVITQGPSAAIQRRLDGKWFNAGDGTWALSKVENAMAQTDSVNLPGRYHFDFDQSLEDMAGSTEYAVKKQNFVGTLALEYEDLVFGPLAGATSPTLCSVQGSVSSAQGEPRQNVLVRATLEPVYTDGLGHAFEADSVVMTYTNELGDFDMPLVRGGVFRIEIAAVGYNRRALIPDLASVLFTDL
jgi:hypothetical protein